MWQRVQAALKISFRLSRLTTERIQEEAGDTSVPSFNIKESVSEKEKNRQGERTWAKACQSGEEEGENLVKGRNSTGRAGWLSRASRFSEKCEGEGGSVESTFVLMKPCQRAPGHPIIHVMQSL